MTRWRPKDRVLAAFSRQEPDRVPINYLANPGIDRRLKEHFGLAHDDHEGLLTRLGVDFRHLTVAYCGPRIHPEVPGRVINEWGMRMAWVEHASGGYWDYCDFPLKDATLDDIEAWPLPSPDHYDYASIAPRCRQWKDFCIMEGDPGHSDIINSTGMLRTMEQTLIDMVTQEPVFLRLIERRQAIQLEVLYRILESARGAVDLLWIGEDLGTQRGPTISLDMYREVLRPWHQQFVDLGKAFNIPVMVHSCGSSSWAFEDFIEMGVGVVDTLQPEAANMAPDYLKRRFGDRLAFHGCISTAGSVACGSVADTVNEVRRTLDVMKPGGGYALAPTHLLQDNSPTENVVALYDAAREYGRYK